MVLDGQQNQIKEKLNLLAKEKVPNRGTVITDDLSDKIQHSLIEMITAVLKLNPTDIDVDTDFSEYGFDSITLTQFANHLNQTLHLEILPTQFFEYSTLRKLTKYLSDNYSEFFIDDTLIERKDNPPVKQKISKKEGSVRIN